MTLADTAQEPADRTPRNHFNGPHWPCQDHRNRISIQRQNRHSKVRQLGPGAGHESTSEPTRMTARIEEGLGQPLQTLPFPAQAWAAHALFVPTMPALKSFLAFFLCAVGVEVHGLARQSIRLANAPLSQGLRVTSHVVVY